MNLWMGIIIGGILLMSSITDLLKKKIHLWVVIVGAILIGICIPFTTSITIWDRGGGVIVGIFVIILSLLTKGKIGMGDGLLLCVTGLGLGFWGNLEMFTISLFLAAVLSIVLLITRLADRKKSIPFVPFLFMGFSILIVNYLNTGVIKL